MKKNQGFSMLEAMIVLASSVVLILGISRVIKALLIETSKVQIQQQGLFYEEFIIEKVTAQLGTLLFWVSNITDSCENSEKLLKGQSIKPCIFNDGSCEIDFSRHLEPDNAQNKISFLDDLNKGSNNNKNSLIDWYNNNKSLKGKDRIWDAINDCIYSVNILKNNLKGKDNFKYCLLIESNLRPDKRLNLLINPKNTKQNSFYFAAIDATFFELIENTNIKCVNEKDVNNFIVNNFMGKLNRTIKVNISLYGIENTNEKERKMMLTKSIFIPKAEREAINCNKENKNDPAWCFQCSC